LQTAPSGGQPLGYESFEHRSSGSSPAPKSARLAGPMAASHRQPSDPVPAGVGQSREQTVSVQSSALGQTGEPAACGSRRPSSSSAPGREFWWRPSTCVTTPLGSPAVTSSLRPLRADGGRNHRAASPYRPGPAGPRQPGGDGERSKQLDGGVSAWPVQAPGAGDVGAGGAGEQQAAAGDRHPRLWVIGLLLRLPRARFRNTMVGAFA
jgi:hypothetical protein